MLGKGASSKNIAVYKVSHNEVYACPQMGRDGGRSRKAKFFEILWTYNGPVKQDNLSRFRIQNKALHYLFYRVNRN